MMLSYYYCYCCWHFCHWHGLCLWLCHCHLFLSHACCDYAILVCQWIIFDSILCNVYLSFVAYSLLLKEYIRIVSPHVQWSMQCKFIQHFNHVLLSASTSLLVFISSTYFSWSDLTFVFALFQRDQGKLSGVVSITPLIWFQWNEPSTIFIWCQWPIADSLTLFWPCILPTSCSNLVQWMLSVHLW